MGVLEWAMYVLPRWWVWSTDRGYIIGYSVNEGHPCMHVGIYVCLTRMVGMVLV